MKMTRGRRDQFFFSFGSKKKNFPNGQFKVLKQLTTCPPAKPGTDLSLTHYTPGGRQTVHGLFSF